MNKYFRVKYMISERTIIDREQLNKAENQFIILKTKMEQLNMLEGKDTLNSLSIVRSHINKHESITTAQIEGSKITDEELQNELVKTDFRNVTVINERFDKYREPLNTMRVLKTFNLKMEKYGLGTRSIKIMHKELFDKVSQKTTQGSRGEFKTVNNALKDSMTGEVIFEPAGLDIMDSEFSSFETFLNNPVTDLKQAILNSGVAHAWFERIHPFTDGNGRVGRMIVPFYFLMNDFIDNNFITLSTEIRSHQAEYYRALNTIQETSSYNEWIDFYLRIFSTSISKINTFIDKIIQYKMNSIKSLELSTEKFVKENKEILSSIMMKRGIFSIKWFEGQLIKAHEKGSIKKIPSHAKLYDIMDSLSELLGMKLISKKPRIYKVMRIPQFII